jgi:hypothetical protein
MHCGIYEWLFIPVSASIITLIQGNSNGCQCTPQVYINYEQSSGRSLEALKEMYQMLQEMMKDDTGGVWCTYLYTKDKIPSKVCQCG